MSDVSAVSPPRTLARDALGVMGTRAVQLLALFLTSVVLARQLGPDGRGLLAAILVYPGLLISLFEGGIRQSATFHLGKTTHPEGLIVSSVALFWLIFSALSLPACLALLDWVSASSFPPAMIALAAGSIPLSLAAAYSRGIFLGKQRIVAFNRSLWIEPLLALALTLALAATIGLTPTGALAAMVAASALTLVWVLVALARMVPIRFALDLGLLRQMLRLGAVYALALFLINLNYRVDIIMLDRLSDTAALGQYSVGVKLSELLWQLPIALGPVLFSHGANARDAARFSLRVFRILRLSLLVTLLGAAGFYATAWLAVPLLYGAAFAPSVAVIHLLLPGIIAATVFKILHADLAGRGRPHLSLGPMVLGLALNVLLNLVLIPRRGAEGAALASSLSYAAISLLTLVLYTHVLKIPLREILLFRRGDFAGLQALLRRAWPRRRGVDRERTPS